MNQQQLREKLYEIIFGTETRWGKRFDEILIVCILLSVFAVMLDSIESISISYKAYLVAVEWTFTVLFTAEYIVRIYCSPKPFGYMRSAFGLVDLLSILPSL